MKKICLIIMLLFTGCGSNSNDEPQLQQEMRLKHLALAAIDSGNLDLATTYLQGLELMLPMEAFVYANQGVVALRQNKLDEAISLFDKANTYKPNDPEIAILKSQSLALQGKFKEAANVLDKPIILSGEDNIHLWWASAELNRGNDKNLILDASHILQVAPKNLVARLMLIKALLGEGKLDDANGHLLILNFQKVIQGETVNTLFKTALEQIELGNAKAAMAQVIGLDNVLKPTRAWQQSLLEVAGPPGTIGHPVRHFLNTHEPAQRAISSQHPEFTKIASSVVQNIDHGLLVVEGTNRSSLVAARGAKIDGLSDETDFMDVGSTIRMLLQIDWNNDRFMDVAIGTEDGSVLIFEQGESNWRLRSLHTGHGQPVRNVTAWDADLDGDLDLLVSSNTTFLLQNNGDETATEVRLDAPLLSSAHIIDFDEDGDGDIAAIDAANQLVILKNERSGNIRPIQIWLENTSMNDLAVGDINNDGWMDIAFIGDDHAAYHGINANGDGFDVIRIGGTGNKIQLLDATNSGWLETLVVGESIQLISQDGQFTSLPTTGEVQIVDANLDGHLDLLVVNGESSAWHQTPTNQHQYQKIVLEAILKGGQRNNAFGVGGFVEVKSGGRYQKRQIEGPLTHVGLGDSPADVIRIVWPNGVPQDVVDPKPNQVFTEVQILKGSCPFLATKHDGRWEFVTDLLWRSPLGLKINAQTVPPIAATQDWVKVSGDQLHAKNGIYELAITAQLWETHFIDEVKMLAVDHPVGTEIFVDERFVAPVPPEYALYTYDLLHSPVNARDHKGRDVTNIISKRDGNRLGGFNKGAYQGIAEDHFIELDLGNIDLTQGVDIVAQGWIRPTDTSINVASAQNRSTPSPSGIRVDIPDGQDGWKTVIPNGGFPAGKLKTIVLEIPRGSFVNQDNRVRIATNLEIYWDRIAYTTKATLNIRETDTELLAAELGYMGYPEMSRPNADAPNVPDYNNIKHHAAWRDLEGFYTRYGTVSELLDEVDDRYVIMNAGDVMYLEFKSLDPPAMGFTRDFIFFSDGWVKDGDWNTVESQTVGPLPHHHMSDYPYPLEERPPTLLPSHSDWQNYHTRFVTTTPFKDALKH